MANNHGGARIGAGRRKKPLADKILEGNPGHRKLTIVDFQNADEIQGEPIPPPHAFMSAKQSNGKDLVAADVYKITWTWLQERSCTHLVFPRLVEQYAMAVARWIQCEEYITEHGLLESNPATGKDVVSPYVKMGQTFGKQANSLWFLIYQAVKESCTTPLNGKTPHDTMMEKILSAQKN